MSIPTEVRHEISELLRRSPYAAFVGLIVAAWVLAANGHEIFAGAGVMFVAGIVSAALLILSWRYYRPMLSWLMFGIPSALLILALFDLVLGAPLAAGIFSVLTAAGVIVGASGFGFFGSLFLLRSRLMRWLRL